MKSRYEAAKNVFVDSIDIDDYIELDSSVSAYKKLQESIEKQINKVLTSLKAEKTKAKNQSPKAKS